MSIVLASINLSVTWLALGILVAGICALANRFVRDNRNTLVLVDRGAILRSLLTAFLLSIPFSLTLLPGIGLMMVVDSAIESGLRSIAELTESGIDQTEKELETMPSFWFNPISWTYKTFLRRVVTVERVHQAGTLSKYMFAALEKLLLIGRWQFYLLMSYVAARSFGFLWARALLGQGLDVRLKVRSATQRR